MLKAGAIRCGSNTCRKSSAYLLMSTACAVFPLGIPQCNAWQRVAVLVILRVSSCFVFATSKTARYHTVFPTLSFCFSTSYRPFSALSSIAANTSSFTLPTRRLDAALSHEFRRTLLLASLPISVTFIYGRAHTDSCFLMREAFNWSVATLARSPLMARGEAARGNGPQSGTVWEYRGDVCARAVMCACWGCMAVRALFPGTLSRLFICYLIRSVLTKNHSEVKDAGKWILMLSGWGFIFSSVYWRLSCFVGFLIKTHKANVVCDTKGYAWIWGVVRLIGSVVDGSVLPSTFAQ